MDTALARNTDPGTSHAAARGVAVQERERQVLETLRRYGPLTTFEIARHLGISRETISPRLKPLARKALVRDTGERRSSGGTKNCIVWGLVTL
jgi:DNA-binding CsgD family transcriptional regulator